MTKSAAPPVVAVVGAGVAGLLAARQLTQVGATVVVVDKSRGVGGRMSTRRIGDAVLDHGAQFFTARSETFRAEVATWIDAGIAAPWFVGALEADKSMPGSDGAIRYRGVPAMTGIAKHLARGLDVRLSSHVESATTVDQQWRIALADGDDLVADAIVLTAPAPQTLAMLDTGSIHPTDRERLEQIDYDPCIALLAVLDTPPTMSKPGAQRPPAGPVTWFADNATKGVSTVPALTIHAGPDASRALWEASDEIVVETLVRGLGLDGSAIRESSVHRWRFARAVATDPELCLVLRGAAPAAVAGDGFGTGGRVETAALSGLAAASAVAELLGIGEHRQHNT